VTARPSGHTVHPACPPRASTGGRTVRLRRADPSSAGITRRGRGRGFEYFWPSGDKVTDPAVLDRLRGLAIPPAWRDVWICWHAIGHLQAVGTDDAGRRQYLYHPQWRERRDAAKFDHMLDFARRLPDLRAFCVDVLDGGDGLDRDRASWRRPCSICSPRTPMQWAWSPRTSSWATSSRRRRWLRRR
jgi:DNA topoisomerase-1